MNATELLERYSISVLHEPETTRLLAQLFRAGPLSDEALASQLDCDLRDLRRQLARLYRADLVTRVAETTWMTSDAAVAVLRGVDIHDVTARDLLHSLTGRHADRNFLDACVATLDFREQADVRVFQLRTMATIHHWFCSHGEALEDDATRAATYALMFGADDDVRLIDATSHASVRLLVKDRIELVLLEACQAASATLPVPVEDMRLIEESCTSGVATYARSNQALRWLSSLDSIFKDEGVFRATLARALSGALWSRPDRDLVTCSRRWSNDGYVTLWRTMLSREGVSERVSHLVRALTGQVAASHDDLIGTLSSLLRERLDENSLSAGAFVAPKRFRLAISRAEGSRAQIVGSLRLALSHLINMDRGSQAEVAAEIRSVIREIDEVLVMSEAAIGSK